MKKPRSVTYIFVWFVVYFINLNLAMTWFAYDDKYYFYCVGCILSGVYLKPQIDKNIINTDRELSSYNPLYVRGYFRKDAEKSEYWSFLKGIFYCQVAIIVFWASIWIIVFTYQFCPVDWSERVVMLRIPTIVSSDIVFRMPVFFYSKLMIHSMGILFWICNIIWIIIFNYYGRQYYKDFSYMEDSHGTWMPFRYIAKPHGFGYYRPFDCNYYVPKEKIRENLREATQKMGYQYTNTVKTYGGYTDSYLRVKKGELQIFQVVYIQTYSEDIMERQNDIFADFWGRCIENKYKTDNVSLSFLLCVEQGNQELEERFWKVLSVNPQKRRNRLAAVLRFEGISDNGKIYSGKPSLRVLECSGIMKRKRKKYIEMRADFLKLMGLKECNNHRSYWGYEDSEEL